jgi:hypothetical protein
MSHGREASAKWLNFKHFYLLNVESFWFKRPLSDTSNRGKYVWEVTSKLKGCVKKGLESNGTTHKSIHTLGTVL